MEELSPHARAPLRVRAARAGAERVCVEGDVPRGQKLLLVAEDARGEEVQESVLAAGRQRVVQARGGLEELAAIPAGADELGHLLHGRNARPPAAKLRLALPEEELALPLLGAVDDRKWLRATKSFLPRPHDEAVDEPGVAGGPDPLPLPA